MTAKTSAKQNKTKPSISEVLFYLYFCVKDVWLRKSTLQLDSTSFS